MSTATRVSVSLDHKCEAPNCVERASGTISRVWLCLRHAARVRLLLNHEKAKQPLSIELVLKLITERR